MRVILPLAAAALIMGAACSGPEVEGRTPEDAKKIEGPAKDDKKMDESKETTEGVTPPANAKPEPALPEDETTGKAPLTPPPAGNGRNAVDDPKVGG